MTPLSIFARAVALVGGAMVVIRRMQDGEPKPAFGAAPSIPPAKPQGSVPTLKMPTRAGLDWRPDADRGGRAQGQRLRDRPQASPLDRGAARTATCSSPRR